MLRLLSFQSPIRTFSDSRTPRTSDAEREKHPTVQADSRVAEYCFYLMSDPRARVKEKPDPK